MELSSQLKQIVGEERMSDRPEERFIYSRDSGAQPPRQADYVVMPRTVEEVREVVLLANREKIARLMRFSSIPAVGGSATNHSRLRSITSCR